MQPPRSFAELLRQFRRAAGFTQGDLANRARVSIRTLSNLERGASVPHRTTVTLLADALSLPPAQREIFVAAIQQYPPPPDATMNFLASFSHPTSPLIGRTDEMRTLLHLIRNKHIRLVTVTGPAGIGKTRLILDMLPKLAAQTAATIHFIPLAAIQDADLILDSIAQSLRIQAAKGQSLQESVVAALQPTETLLVLDNFEHLLDAAHLVAQLLAACPLLTVLVTSRSALRIRNEHRFPLDALPLPQWVDTQPLEELQQVDSVQLLIERAQEVLHTFALSPVNAPSVAAICRRLEGIPLALELAALRLAVLSPAALLQLLDHQLMLLVTGPRDLPQRQQTMRNAIAWSYELLTDAEQSVFRRLATFVGGWSLTAAQAICQDLQVDLLSLLSALADANLIRYVPRDDVKEPRYTMLEIIREYGLEQLADHHELDRMQRLHAECMLALAAQADVGLQGAEQAIWLERLDDDQGNLRAALHWSQDHDALLGLRLAVALWRFWNAHGQFSEGRTWLEVSFAQTHDFDGCAKDRADACNIISMFAAQQSDIAQAEHFAEISVHLYEEAGDVSGNSSALNSLGNLAFMQDNYDRAEEMYRQALTLGRASGDQRRIALALTNLATVITAQGHFREAQLLLEECLMLRREQASPLTMANILVCLSNLACKKGVVAQATTFAEEAHKQAILSGHRQMIATALDHLGKAAAGQKQFQLARDALERSRDIYSVLGDVFGQATVLRHLGDVARGLGEWQQAEAHLAESMKIFQEIGCAIGTAKCLDSWAQVLLAQKQVAQSARYVRQAIALCENLSISSQAYVFMRLARTKKAIHAAVKEAALPIDAIAIVERQAHNHQ